MPLRVSDQFIDQIYNIIEGHEDVTEARLEFDKALDNVESRLVTLGLTEHDAFQLTGVLSDLANALQASCQQEAYRLGWEHARHPERLIFKESN